MHAMTYAIGISGSYGGMNLGDEAILDGILSGLRQSVSAEVTVFSRNPGDTLARHAVERAVNPRERSRQEIRPEVERLDLLIFGGGGILYDAEAQVYLREVQLAIEAGVPVLVYAISAGPLENPEVRTKVAEALDQVRVITVRDTGSRQLLEDIGVTQDILVVADPALLVEPADLDDEVLAREGVKETRRLIGVSVREPGVAAPDLDESHYHKLLADAADFMIGRFDATLLFVPMERRVLDMQHSHAVISKMAHPERATVLKQDYGAPELLALMGRLEFAVGMRLHFLIFAALRGVPFVALPYSGKVEGFLKDLELDMPTVQEVSAGQLLARIDVAWDLRHELRNTIAAHIEELKLRAREPNRLAVELLTGSAGHRAPAERRGA
jgi:polysaccharide pyruvyl transferase CsaB